MGEKKGNALSIFKQCKANDFEKYKTLKSACIKEDLSRILEENPGTGQQRLPSLTAEW